MDSGQKYLVQPTIIRCSSLRGPKDPTGHVAGAERRSDTRQNKETADNRRLSGGLPHSEIPGSKGVLASPELIAEYHVLHRLLLPRHPPNALLALDPIQKKTGPFACGRFKPQTCPCGQNRLRLPAIRTRILPPIYIEGESLRSDPWSDPVSPVPPGRKSLTRDAPSTGSVTVLDRPNNPQQGSDRQSRSVY
jgi:hypothetical protein